MNDLGTIYRKSTPNTSDKRNAENAQKRSVYAFSAFSYPSTDLKLSCAEEKNSTIFFP